MTKQPKRPRDPNQLAKFVIDAVTGETESSRASLISEKAQKAGLVGGPARARVLTEKRRSEIAKHAAESRWKNTAK